MFFKLEHRISFLPRQRDGHKGNRSFSIKLGPEAIVSDGLPASASLRDVTFGIELRVRTHTLDEASKRRTHNFQH